MTNILDEIDIKLLNDIYEMDINCGKSINIDDYELTDPDLKRKRQELAWHLMKLERLEYVQLNKGAFVEGGIRHEKFKNNVYSIDWEKVHIKDKGIKLISEAKTNEININKQEP